MKRLWTKMGVMGFLFFAGFLLLPMPPGTCSAFICRPFSGG